MISDAGVGNQRILLLSARDPFIEHPVTSGYRPNAPQCGPMRTSAASIDARASITGGAARQGLPEFLVRNAMNHIQLLLAIALDGHHLALNFAVFRDPQNDYGEDLLKKHYEQSHHQPKP